MVEVLGRVGFGVKGLGMAGLHVGSFLKLGSLLGSFYKGAVLYWDLKRGQQFRERPMWYFIVGVVGGGFRLYLGHFQVNS